MKIPILLKENFPRNILIALGIMSVFLQAYRVPVNVIGPGLDRSYPHILNLFSFTSIRYGSDLVYTYGPLGFLLHVENVGHNLALGFVFWTVLYLFISITIVYFIVSLTSGWKLIASLILAIFIAAYIDAERLLPCSIMLLLLIAYEQQQNRKIILALCGFLTAIGLLIKFPIGVACAAMTFASVIAPFKPRLILVNIFTVGLSMALAFSAIWFISCGSIFGMADYFINSFQLTSGYTAVMSVSRPNENASLLSFIIALGILIVVAGILRGGRRSHTLLVILLPLFIAWKHGVVRFDGHIIGLVSITLFLAFLLFVIHLHELEANNIAVIQSNNTKSLFYATKILAIGMLLAIGFILNKGLLLSGLASEGYPLISRSFLENLGGVNNSWLPGLLPINNALRFDGYKKYLDARARTDLAGQKLDNSILKIIDGKSVDIYSYELGFVAANPTLNYDPKPVFQHFNAFTDKLDKLNADFFSSSKRPDFLIMHHPNNGSMVGVDGRYQLYDDPIAFLKIMDLYKPIYVEKNPLKPQIALLQYAPTNGSRFEDPMVLRNELVHWNETVRLPTVDDSSILRVKINLKKPIISSIKEAVFRLSPMYLDYALSDGTHKKYRLVPTHLGSGVWISPLFDYWNLYKFLNGKPWIGPKVVSIRFEAENPQDYPDSFTVIWEKIVCKIGYCNPIENRIYSRIADHLTRSPIPITTSITLPYIPSADSVAAIDVRLSTYAKKNKGALDLEIVNDDGNVVRKSSVDAASIYDNAYELFTFDPISNVKGKKIYLRLKYRAVGNGQIAAWRTAATNPDFDFRAYGH